MGLLYTKMKIFHFKDKIDSLPGDVDRVCPPIHIRLKPTNVCNHGCRYCAYRADNLQLGKDMNSKDFIPREKMIEIIDDIVEMGVKAVTFSGGGEPFCYPYLSDAVRKLAQTKVKFASLTNGSKLEGELAEIFAYNATWLRVSMDGWDDESYSLYRRVSRGEFVRVMKNIENFIRLSGKCYLGVSIVADNLNSSHLYKFMGILRDAGVDSVKVSPCIVSNDGKANDAYHKPFFNVAKEQIARAMADFSSDEFEIFDAYHDMNEEFSKDYTWCPYLQILSVIGADMNVYSCQDKAYNLDEGLIGSIKGKRFRDFWFEGKYKFYEINPSVVCNHRCVANTKNKLIMEYLHADKEHLGFV